MTPAPHAVLCPVNGLPARPYCRKGLAWYYIEPTSGTILVDHVAVVVAEQSGVDRVQGVGGNGLVLLDQPVRLQLEVGEHHLRVKGRDDAVDGVLEQNDALPIVGRLRDRGIGILITDHNVRETLAITDRAYILYDGKILVSGTASEIASNPIAREIYLGEKFAL